MNSFRWYTQYWVNRRSRRAFLKGLATLQDWKKTLGNIDTAHARYYYYYRSSWNRYCKQARASTQFKEEMDK